MSNKEQDSKKPTAISKQVLKTNPIPQTVQTSTSTKNQTNENNTAISDKNVKGKPTQPLRSTKVSQKLVLFPQSDETGTTSTLPIDDQASHEQQTQQPQTPVEEQHYNDQDESLSDQKWQDPRGVPLPIEWTFGSRTQAERMTKEEREISLLPRAAAYYTGEGYDLNRLRPFLRQHHHVSPRLYDECLYAPYHFPLRTLRPDKDNLFNIRVRSNVSKPPNSRRNTLDAELMDYEEDHLERNHVDVIRRGSLSENYPNHKHFYEDDDDEEYHRQDTVYEEEEDLSQQQTPELQEEEKEEKSVQKPPKPFKGGEVFIFDYGVVVFWNFRRAEELLMLEDFMKFSLDPFRDNPDEDLQIEELHFQYDTSQMKPRIFNDMITLKSGNHMIKLTISHGLSQSAVVARYEDIMDKTIEDTKHLPKEMAESGRLGKTRTEITKINGQLFNLRMNVNLVSNVLDTPEIFWSEPALQPMYTAIREYLEIPQRAKILNDRLRVISDLLSMLRDHLTNFGVEYQTLIIIYLIIIAVIVACFEIAVKTLQSIDIR